MVAKDREAEPESEMDNRAAREISSREKERAGQSLRETGERTARPREELNWRSQAR